MFVDSAADDVNTGGSRLIDHGVRVAADRSPFDIGHDHRRAWKEIGDSAMVVLLGIDGGREACAA